VGGEKSCGWGEGKTTMEKTVGKKRVRASGKVPHAHTDKPRKKGMDRAEFQTMGTNWCGRNQNRKEKGQICSRTGSVRAGAKKQEKETRKNQRQLKKPKKAPGRKRAEIDAEGEGVAKVVQKTEKRS